MMVYCATYFPSFLYLFVIFTYMYVVMTHDFPLSSRPKPHSQYHFILSRIPHCVRHYVDWQSSQLVWSTHDIILIICCSQVNSSNQTFALFHNLLLLFKFEANNIGFSIDQFIFYSFSIQPKSVNVLVWWSYSPFRFLLNFITHRITAMTVMPMYVLPSLPNPLSIFHRSRWSTVVLWLIICLDGGVTSAWCIICKFCCL